MFIQFDFGIFVILVLRIIIDINLIVCRILNEFFIISYNLDEGSEE
jgi:hypothetical protein